MDNICSGNIDTTEFYTFCFMQWRRNIFTNPLLKVCRKVYLECRNFSIYTNILCDSPDVCNFERDYETMWKYLSSPKVTK